MIRLLDTMKTRSTTSCTVGLDEVACLANLRHAEPHSIRIGDHKTHSPSQGHPGELQLQLRLQLQFQVQLQFQFQPKSSAIRHRRLFQAIRGHSSSRYMPFEAIPVTIQFQVDAPMRRTSSTQLSSRRLLVEHVDPTSER